MQIMMMLSDGMLIQDQDQTYQASRLRIGEGNYWNRRLPDMDNDYDPDNHAYSDDAEFDPHSDDDDSGTDEDDDSSLASN